LTFNPTNAQEQCELGKKYASGNGVPRNMEIAALWYAKAAYQGHAEAQRQLADSYFLGDGVPKDMEKANLWYIQAAGQGNVDAQYCLANNYLNGDGVPKDPKKALFWYAKAAKLGNAYAQYYIGSAYFTGDGMPKNYKKAQHWLSKSIKQGLDPGMVDACYFLGKSFDRGGFGVLANKKNAVYWYIKAAELGDRASQVRLGEIYLKGAEGVPIDTEKANYWRTKADGPQEKRITASEWVNNKLMELGANASGIALVTQAMAEARTDVMDFLVINGLDVNTKFADGGTLLRLAESKGYIEAIKWLKQHNAG